jgi:D-alanyl-D-alanine carboxypeptidase
LELINLDYPVRIEPAGGAIVPAWPTVPVSTIDITLNAAALNAVGEMLGAAREAGAGTFYVSSGYRDYESQQKIYGEMADKAFAQPPGHSEHQTGLAADILAVGVLQSDMADSPEGRWLAENSWKYGFVLRYAEDKREMTNIAGEPWHFRYIGAPHAWYCHKNNMCLEEYIAFLKNESGYQADLFGICYTVIYVKPENGIVLLPENMDFDISGDNAGGYIITVYEVL